VVVPTASAIPVDPWAGGLVTSPDVHKVPPRTPRKVVKRSDIQFGGVLGPLPGKKAQHTTKNAGPGGLRTGRSF
jgi:hypothetical protein